jgi:hypothetical protein
VCEHDFSVNIRSADGAAADLLSTDHRPGASGYMIQLDSLRAMAVTVVLIGHYVPVTED